MPDTPIDLGAGFTLARHSDGVSLVLTKSGIAFLLPPEVTAALMPAILQLQDASPDRDDRVYRR